MIIFIYKKVIINLKFCMFLKKKILYKSQHRATKELDIILGSFVAGIIDQLSDFELLQLEEIINIEDQKLFDAIFRNIPLENLDPTPILQSFINHYSSYVQSS